LAAQPLQPPNKSTGNGEKREKEEIRKCSKKATEKKEYLFLSTKMAGSGECS
jgi:hypothetical protein